MTTAPRTQSTARTSDAIGQRYQWARAYRDGQLVCGRVEVRIGRDSDRLGLTARERRFVVARFLERVDPALRDELTALVARAARPNIFYDIFPANQALWPPPHFGRVCKALSVCRSASMSYDIWSYTS